MPECRAQFFLLWINSSLQTRFSCCCRTSKQPACLEHLGWNFQLILDFENVSAFHARASFLATYQPSFVLFCSQIRGHCRSAVWMGHRTYKRCPLADRPLSRRLCSSGDEELWTWSNGLDSSKWIGNIHQVHTSYQVYLAPRIHVIWKDWTCDLSQFRCLFLQLTVLTKCQIKCG